MSLPSLSHSLPPSQKLPQTLLVLVGLIGSGKSSLANALERDLGWMRCNQDELQGDRRLVEKKVRAGLSQGLNVVVDRTNFDPQQRAHFLNIASNFPKVQKWALFLDVPLPLCLSRLSTRTNHPTITSFAQAQQVLLKFSSQLRVPTPSEGFDRVLHLTDLVPLEIPRALLEELVGRIEKEGERQTLWSRSQWGGGGQGNGFGNVGGGGGGDGRGGYGGGGAQGQGRGGGYRGGGQGWHGGGGGGGAETRRSDSAGSWR